MRNEIDKLFLAPELLLPNEKPLSPVIVDAQHYLAPVIPLVLNEQAAAPFVNNDTPTTLSNGSGSALPKWKFIIDHGPVLYTDNTGNDQIVRVDKSFKDYLRDPTLGDGVVLGARFKINSFTGGFGSVIGLSNNAATSGTTEEWLSFGYDNSNAFKAATDSKSPGSGATFSTGVWYTGFTVWNPNGGANGEIYCYLDTGSGLVLDYTSSMSAALTVSELNELSLFAHNQYSAGVVIESPADDIEIEWAHLWEGQRGLDELTLINEDAYQFFEPVNSGAWVPEIAAAGSPNLMLYRRARAA